MSPAGRALADALWIAVEMDARALCRQAGRLAALDSAAQAAARAVDAAQAATADVGRAAGIADAGIRLR